MLVNFFDHISGVICFEKYENKGFNGKIFSNRKQACKNNIWIGVSMEFGVSQLTFCCSFVS
jgi:hypothetical protein